jgi:hypothetical protein
VHNRRRNKQTNKINKSTTNSNANFQLKSPTGEKKFLSRRTQTAGCFTMIVQLLFVSPTFASAYKSFREQTRNSQLDINKQIKKKTRRKPAQRVMLSEKLNNDGPRLTSIIKPTSQVPTTELSLSTIRL